MKNIDSLFQQFRDIKIGIIGDVMLDSYMWGDVERISPEAPVPVVTLKNKDYRIGGAGNVALNLKSLGAQPFVISVTGKDAEAGMLYALLSENNISHQYCISSQKRITTNKTRIISRNQQMMRLDAEITNDLDREEEEMLLNSFKDFIKKEKPDIMILEDYNKGVLTGHVINEAISECRAAGILTAVDPKRKNFTSYKHVDIFKPNLKEIRESLHLFFNEVDQQALNDAHNQLFELLNHRISLITLSELGIYYNENGKSSIIPSHLRKIADVSGAGDTVIAVAALVYAASKDVELMAAVANIAGGLVCEQVGTVAIDRNSLLHECNLLLS